jgi:DNA-binding IclR family transcriptional regulator
MELQKVLPQVTLRRFTPNTITNHQELGEHLQRVRKAGHALDLEEHEPHIRCIAAPIWDHSGSVVASLSVTAPTVRMPTTRLRQLAPMIQEAGLQISHKLGFQLSET